MAAVAAVIGLVAGIVLGLSSPGSQPRASAAAPTGTTRARTTTTLPRHFYTVVLGSYNDRANANARLREVRGMGVRDAGILQQSEWDLRTVYAVYSGRFDTQEKALAHREELAQYGIPEEGRFLKEVTRKD